MRAALRLGAYQLVAGMPAHAAVGETVARGAATRARGYVNAVLRALARPGRRGRSLATATRSPLSMPDWIVDRLVADLGAERRARGARGSNEPPARHVAGEPAARDGAVALAEELDGRGGASVDRGGSSPTP